MKFRLVTYRWGRQFLGGAELHHQRLARELVDLGHEVEVWTTDGGEIRTFCHWGVQWERLAPNEVDDAGFEVRRFPMKQRGKTPLALAAKILQRRMEKEEAAIDPAFLSALAREAPARPAVHLLSGWHYPEMGSGGPTRWSQGRAFVYTDRESYGGCRLVLTGYSPKANELEILSGGTRLAAESIGPGGFRLEMDLSQAASDILQLRVKRVWRPARDFRGLGVMVQRAELVDAETGEPKAWADIGEDYRSLGRQAPVRWQQFLLNRAESRPRFYSRLINFLRGPQSPALRRALRQADDAVTIHCNLPWASMSLIRPGDFAVPLWHMEDEFFYWRHWHAALKRARLAFANTPYAADDFFAKLGIDASFVGPPIWPAEKATPPEAVGAFRAEHRLDENEILVITVCRKSPEKRYDAIAASVARLRGEGLAIRMIGVGPDGDGRPFEYDGCAWIGRLQGQSLQTAFAACDVFSLMSESESFGMVIPEAWHHGKPVVVNRGTRPAASLVDEEVDGLLALPGKGLDEALRRLARDRELRERLGSRGREKARGKYRRGAAGERLIAAMEERGLVTES